MLLICSSSILKHPNKWTFTTLTKCTPLQSEAQVSYHKPFKPYLGLQLLKDIPTPKNLFITRNICKVIFLNLWQQNACIDFRMLWNWVLILHVIYLIHFNHGLIMGLIQPVHVASYCELSIYVMAKLHMTSTDRDRGKFSNSFYINKDSVFGST